MVLRWIMQFASSSLGSADDPRATTSTGIAAIDRLFATPPASLPNHADIADLSTAELRTKFTELAPICDLKDEQLGAAMAALLTQDADTGGVRSAEAQSAPQRRRVLWRMCDGRARWNERTAVAMLAQTPARADKPVDEYTPAILQQSFENGPPKSVVIALRDFLDAVEMPTHGLSSDNEERLRQMELLAERDPDTNRLIVEKQAMLKRFQQIEAELLAAFGDMTLREFGKQREAESASSVDMADWEADLVSADPATAAQAYLDFQILSGFKQGAGVAPRPDELHRGSRFQHDRVPVSGDVHTRAVCKARSRIQP